MSISKETTLLPKLRFNEFTNNELNYNYKNYSFNDIFLFSTGKNIKQNEASPKFKFPCVRYGELYHMYGEVIYDVINKTNLPESELIFSKGDEILLPSAGEDPIGISSASALPFKGIAIGRTINILRPKKENLYSQYYVSYYINEKLKKDIARLANGVQISNVYNSDLKKLNIILPSQREQKKVAEFLSSVDKKIQLLEKKKEQLEIYKRGVMQKIFSREIRFKDNNGNTYPDWESNNLGNLCEITTGKLDANAMVEKGNYRFYTCAKNYYQIDKYEFDTDALIVSGNGANVGYIHRYNGKFNAYQRTYVLDDFDDNILYIKYFLNKYLHKRIFKEKRDGNTPYITMSTLTEMEIIKPSLVEQKKIADFLSAIDNKIDTTSTQIDKTKEFKKGLLQQMFV